MKQYDTLQWRTFLSFFWRELIEYIKSTFKFNLISSYDIHSFIYLYKMRIETKNKFY